VVDGKLNMTLKNGLLFIGSRLVIPKYCNLCESLFCLAHDDLGYFGGKKLYASLWDGFYWPNMRKDLLSMYIPACTKCQRNKSQTKKTPGPLHPLLIPDQYFNSVAIDFVGPLPVDDGFNGLVTMTDHLGADIQLALCLTDITAEKFADIFFDQWYCENGCPLEIISNHDKLFISKFWKALMKRMGIKHKLSMAYHPETDGSSERTNKMVVQCLRYHVERNQKGWVCALPKV
jgi:hypothetical protein